MPAAREGAVARAVLEPTKPTLGEVLRRERRCGSGREAGGNVRPGTAALGLARKSRYARHGSRFATFRKVRSPPRMKFDLSEQVTTQPILFGRILLQPSSPARLPLLLVP